MSIDCNPQSEAKRLLKLHNGQVDKALSHVEQHLGVLQTRSQFLLTIGTLTLTITGFSGPTIAKASDFSAAGLSLGLVLVLAALVLLLVGSLRIHWLSHFIGEDDVETIAHAVAWRDKKARFFNIQLCLLVCGLSAYVIAVVNFFLQGIV